MTHFRAFVAFRDERASIRVLSSPKAAEDKHEHAGELVLSRRAAQDLLDIFGEFPEFVEIIREEPSKR